MKNLLITFDFLELGGGTRININIIKALHKKYRIIFLTGINQELWSKDLLTEIKRYSTVYAYDRTRYIPEIINDFISAIKTWQLYRKISKIYSFDYIALNLVFSSIPFIFLRKTINSRIIYFFHGAIFLERLSRFKKIEIQNWKLFSKFKFYIKNLFLRYFQQFTIDTADCVVCFSKYSRSVLKQSFNTFNKKVSIVRAPAYFDYKLTKKELIRKEIGVDPDAKIIISTSRIEPRKGIHQLISAFRWLHKRNKKTLLFLIGPSYDLGYFYNLFMSVKDLEGSVHFLGPCTNKVVLKYVAGADLMILPSVNFETFGVATVESLALGTPVIGFPRGATAEILKSVSSDLVAGNTSPISLGKTIYNYLNKDREEVNYIIKNGINFVKNTYNEANFQEDFRNL